MADENFTTKAVVFVSPDICHNAACAPNLPWSAIQTTHFHTVCKRCGSEAFWDRAHFAEPPPCSSCARDDATRAAAIRECAELARKRIPDTHCECGCHCGASVVREIVTEFDALAGREKA